MTTRVIFFLKTEIPYVFQLLGFQVMCAPSSLEVTYYSVIRLVASKPASRISKWELRKYDGILVGKE